MKHRVPKTLLYFLNKVSVLLTHRLAMEGGNSSEKERREMGHKEEWQRWGGEKKEKKKRDRAGVGDTERNRRIG